MLSMRNFLTLTIPTGLITGSSIDIIVPNIYTLRPVPPCHTGLALPGHTVQSQLNIRLPVFIICDSSITPHNASTSYRFVVCVESIVGEIHLH